jgi:hypothetical protein
MAFAGRLAQPIEDEHMKKWILVSVGGFALRWIQKQMGKRSAVRRQRDW